MSVIIRLLVTAAGTPTEFDGKYVRRYDPTYRRPDGSYDGGILEVTRDPREALRFAGPRAAIDAYRSSYGIRPDGEPNRPLTAWNISIEPQEES